MNSLGTMHRARLDLFEYVLTFDKSGFRILQYLVGLFGNNFGLGCFNI